MFQQAIPRSFVWLVSMWAVLTIGIIGCGGDDDDNEWVGTWELVSVDGETFEEAIADEEGEELGIEFSIDPNSWTFNDDGTMEVEFGVEFEVDEEGLAFSLQGAVKMIGTYSLSGDSYTMKITEVVEVTGLFEDFEEEELSPIDSTDDDADTGTWHREGDTLTLNSDDGSIVVFKKK